MTPTTPLPAAATSPHPRGDAALRLIAGYKLCEGLLLLSVALELLRLVHQDLADVVTGWVASFRIDPENEHIHAVLIRLGFFDARRLKELSVGSFFYAALELTEGTGLWFKKRWAEYFTVLATGAFVPLEVYELVKQPTLTKLALMAINVALVVYLAVNLRRTRRNSAGD